MPKLHLARNVSESSLDAYIPSYPGSPSSLYSESKSSIVTVVEQEDDPTLSPAIAFLRIKNEFLEAAELGDDFKLDMLIKNGVDIQQRDYLGRNALHLAVCSGKEPAIKLLLISGVNTDVKDFMGKTPLSLYLLRRPNVRIINLFFEVGATIDRHVFLQFAILCVPTRQEIAVLSTLVKRGAHVNDHSAPGGRQALHFAAMSNNTTMIDTLVDLGANLFVTNHRKETPKEFAELFKCNDAYKLLEELEDYKNQLIDSPLPSVTSVKTIKSIV